jgi:hypothetical protein
MVFEGFSFDADNKYFHAIVVKDNLNCFLFLAIAPSPLEN